MQRNTTNGRKEPGADVGELVAEDDVIIGRAFRGSLLVLGAALVIGAIVFLYRRGDSGPPLVDEQPVVLPRGPRTAANVPAVPFVDVTQEAGINFVHENGGRGEKLLPETMGGGCAWLDFDNDRDPDLLLINSGTWSDGNGNGGGSDSRPTLELYENDGRGRFTRVTEERTPPTRLYGMGTAIGDYDNDGDTDVFVSAVGPNALLRNDDGEFQDVTAEAGVAGGSDEWSSGCGFLDYDNDGFLDLFVCNYIRWSRDIDLEVDYRLVGIGRAYGPPTNFEGSHPYLYRNRGDGTFEDVTERAGLYITNPATGVPVAKALAIAPLDFDRDGWIDFFVANDTVQNFLFHNRRNGTFSEIGAERGVAFDSQGESTGAMGIDTAYYRNDNAVAAAIGNFATEMSSFYVAPGHSGGFFTDEAITEGIGPVSRQMLTFGLFFFDYDLDGFLDLLQVNGHLEDEINIVQPSQHYRQIAQLFWNRGGDTGGSLVPVSPETTADLATPIVGRGAGYADVDGDGDLDVVLTQTGGPPLLLRNDQSLGHHWLRVRLRGRISNGSGIGSWVELSAGGRTQRRQVMPTRSYLSQVELPVTFGLGTVDRVDQLRVIWLGGKTQAVLVQGIDREIEVEEIP